MRPRPDPFRNLLGGGLSLMALAGCTVGPGYLARPPAMPAAFAGVDPAPDKAPLSRALSRGAELTAWWRGFRDPELDTLVARALAQNLDRETAASRVRQSHRQADEARAALYPELDGSVEVSHTRISNNSGLSSIGSLLNGGGGAQTGSSGGGASGGGASASSAGFPGIEFDTYTLGLNADYDLDPFGKNKHAARAARERAEAQVWSARDTDVTVTSEVATAYLQLRLDQARLKVVQDNARSQQTLLNLVGVRGRGGLITQIDVAQQRSQLATTQAQVGPLESSIDTGRHQIAVLLGVAAQALDEELAPRPDPVAALPAAPPEVPVGLPSDLLKRRPDIRGAERQLAASVEDVGQATAALYPDVTLTGVVSLVSSELGSLFDYGSRNYTGAAQLTAPLFDGGRLRAQKHERQEAAIQAAVTYRQTVLTGLQQVADALARYGADQREVKVLGSGYAESRRAADLNRAQYLGGLADQQATLRADAQALLTQDQFVQAQGRVATDLVALFKALGGGWEGTPAVPRRKFTDALTLGTVPAAPSS